MAPTKSRRGNALESDKEDLERRQREVWRNVQERLKALIAPKDAWRSEESSVHREIRSVHWVNFSELSVKEEDLPGYRRPDPKELEYDALFESLIVRNEKPKEIVDSWEKYLRDNQKAVEEYELEIRAGQVPDIVCLHSIQFQSEGRLSLIDVLQEELPESPELLPLIEAVKRLQLLYKQGDLTEADRLRIKFPWSGEMILVIIDLSISLDEEEGEQSDEPPSLINQSQSSTTTRFTLSQGLTPTEQAAEEEFIVRELYRDLFGCSDTTIATLTGINRERVNTYLRGPRQVFEEEKTRLIRGLSSARRTRDQIAQVLKQRYPFGTGISPASVSGILAGLPKMTETKPDETTSTESIGTIDDETSAPESKTVGVRGSDSWLSLPVEAILTNDGDLFVSNWDLLPEDLKKKHLPGIQGVLKVINRELKALMDSQK